MKSLLTRISSSREEVITGTGSMIVNVTTIFPLPLISDADKVAEYIPARVGVPEIILFDRVRPGGNEPESL